MQNLRQLEKMLRDKKYKVTPARVAILQLFSAGCNPYNAEKIFAKLKKSIDSVTIYRTLTSFEKTGILRKVSLGEDSAYFELNIDHHHHIICTNCKRVSDFVLGDDKNLIKKILEQAKDFRSVSGHTFDLFGLCSTCFK